MEWIIDSILSFLQYDLASLFKFSDSCCLCLKFPNPCRNMKCPQLLGKVKEPLQECCCYGALDQQDCEAEDDDDEDCRMCCACEGLGEEEEEAEEEAEEEEEQDECKDNDVALLSDNDDCSKESVQQPDEDPCKVVCQQIMAELAHKCSSATLMELRSIEDRAMKIWDALNANIRNTCLTYPTWWNLKTWQKLPFYWAALSNEILCEDPFENFKRFYISHIHTNRRSQKLVTERALIVWHNMSKKQRLPFIMEAFISKVGAGKVDIKDDQEIHNVFRILHQRA